MTDPSPHPVPTTPAEPPGAPGDSGGTDGPGAPIPARAVLRPIGNGLPLGYPAFALGTVLLAGLAPGWVAQSQTREHGVLLAAYVVPLELVATVVAFLARDTVGAATLGVFTTSWLGLVEAAWRRPLLPTLRRGAAAGSLHGVIATTDAGLRSEPGVRQQL